MADPIIPGDKKNEADKNTPIEAAQEDPTPTLDQDDAKPAVMVGLSADEIGLSAKQDTPKQTPYGIQNPSAQDLKNTQDEEQSIFTASPKSAQLAEEQINKGRQGAAHGHIAGVMGATQETVRLEEEKKKERTMALNLAAIAMSAEMQAAYAQLDKDLSEMEDNVQDISVDFEALAQETNEVIAEMQVQREAAAADLARYEQELIELQNGTSSIYTGDDPEMIAAQIALKQAEIDNARSRVELIDNTINETQAKLAETQKTIADSVVELNKLRQQEQEAKLSGDPEGKLEEIRRQMANAESTIKSAEIKVDEFRQNAEITKAISTLAADLEDKSQSCGINAEVELEKAARINAKTELINTLSDKAADGEVTHADMKEISARMTEAGVDETTRANFIASVYTAGGTFYDENNKAIGQDELLARWDELAAQEVKLEQEIEANTQQIEQETATAQAAAIGITQANTDLAQQEQLINAQDTKLQELQQQLATVDADIAREQAELSQLKQNMETVEQALDTHGSVFGFMYERHSATEAIAGLKVEESQLLTHNGQHVFMDNETQEFYTVSGEGEDQVKHIIDDPVDDMNLRAQVFSGEKYPSNFVTNSPTESRFDSYYGTMAQSGLGAAASLIGADAGMSEQEAREVSSQALAAQKNLIETQSRPALENSIQDAETRKAQLEQQMAEVTKAKDALVLERDEALATAQNLEAQNVAKEGQLADVREEQDEIQTVAQRQNIDLPDDEEQNTDQRSADEAYVLNTPDVNLDEAEASRNKALGAVEAAALSGGALTQQQYEELSQLPGMSPKKLDDMMAPHKLEVNDFASNVKLESDSPALAPAANDPIYVQHFGQTVEHTAIAAPTVTPDANGVEPGIYPGSFADSDDFAKTNPSSGPLPEYLTPVNNHIENVVSAVSNWFDAQSDKPEVAATGLTPEQQEQQLRMQNELAQNDPQINNPNTGTGGGMMG